MNNILSPRQRNKLQRLIDAVVRTQAPYARANAALMDYSRELYDCEPGDVDADFIIDSLGGDGEAGGLSADEFDREMRPHMR